LLNRLRADSKDSPSSMTTRANVPTPFRVRIDLPHAFHYRGSGGGLSMGVGAYPGLDKESEPT